MLIGLPKEIKDNENRVGMTPGAVQALVRRGHQVLVQNGTGEDSSLSDEEYRSAVAEIVSYAEDAWAAQMVVKVKEPGGIGISIPAARPDSFYLFASGIG
jgi:alanine dehydrogenase